MESGSTPYTRSELQNNGVYAYTWDNVWEWGVAGRAYKLANAGYKVSTALIYLLMLGTTCLEPSHWLMLTTRYLQLYILISG